MQVPREGIEGLFASDLAQSFRDWIFTPSTPEGEERITAVIEHLRQDAQYRQLPVIVLTAKTLMAADYALLAQNVRTVLPKRGLERGTLIEELQGLLRAHQDSTQVATLSTATPEG